MIDISFKDDVMYYSGIPFNLYGIIGKEWYDLLPTIDSQIKE